MSGDKTLVSKVFGVSILAAKSIVGPANLRQEIRLRHPLLTAFALLAATLPIASTHLQAAGATPTAATREARLRQVLGDWLAAFNSGDSKRIKAFYVAHLNDDNPVFAQENAVDTCGFALEKIETQTETTMTVLLSQRCLPGLQRATLELAPDGTKLKRLDFRPLPLPGNKAVGVTANIAGRLAARDDFAGSIIVMQHGKRELARNWGKIENGKAARVSLDTPMFLASAGKMFTAVAVLQLVDSGKIELDAPLGTYLTNYPNAKMAKVTIRQLLTHRGGTGDIGILERGDSANRARVHTIDDMIALNGNRPPDFEPGSKPDYSNYGFILLGAVIEQVTGRSYYDYVAEHVFAPAGMTSTGFPDKDHLRGIAVGYTTFYGAETKKIANTDVLPWRGASAGGGVSTANDMVRFFSAMRSGKLLSPTMFELATKPGQTNWYGMGFVLNSGASESWGHGGNSYGMDVAAHHFVRNDTTFICLATRDMVCNRLIFAWYLRTFAPES